MTTAEPNRAGPARVPRSPFELNHRLGAAARSRAASDAVPAMAAPSAPAAKPPLWHRQ